MDKENQDAIEFLEATISVAIALSLQILIAIAIFDSGRGFSNANFAIVFLAVPACCFLAFTVYLKKRQRPTLGPAIAHGIFSAFGTILHAMFWASRLPTV